MNIYYLQKENEEKEKVPCKTNPQENQKNEEIISPNPSSEKERKGKEKMSIISSYIRNSKKRKSFKREILQERSKKEN